MQFGHVVAAGVEQGGQRVQALADVFQRHGLQFGAAGQHLRKGAECRLDRFAALRQAVEVTGAVVVRQRGDAGDIGLGFEVAPGHQLRQCGCQFFSAGGGCGPGGFGQHLVGPQLQPVLALGSSEDIEHGAVQGRLVGADMAKQFGSAGPQVHGLSSLLVG